MKSTMKFVLYFLLLLCPWTAYANVVDVKLEVGKTTVTKSLPFDNNWSVITVADEGSAKDVLLGRLLETHSSIFQYEFILFRLTGSEATVFAQVKMQNVVAQTTRLSIGNEAMSAFLTIETKQ